MSDQASDSGAGQPNTSEADGEQVVQSETPVEEQGNAESAPDQKLPKRVFVNNFPFTTTEEEIQNLFAKCGKIISVKMLTTAQGRPRGIAFVQYETQEHAEEAIKTFNKSEFKGRVLNVEFTTQDDDGVDRFRRKLGRDRSARMRERSPLYDRHGGGYHAYPPPYGGYEYREYYDKYRDSYRQPPYDHGPRYDDRMRYYGRDWGPRY